MWDAARAAPWGLAGLAGAMALAWLRQRRTANAGLVDVLWTFGIGAQALLYALAGDGWAPRRILVASLAGLWATRLGLHLARRVASEPEDGRYARLRRELGARFDRWIFWFFQAQALLAFLLAVPFLVLCQARTAGWRWSDGLALLLWLVSIVGERTADRQLARWRREPANRGRTCHTGLWRFSRHPNYFFEWLHWLVYPLMGIGVVSGWQGWALWAAPAAMLLLILKVTGIPPTEARALESRGDDYRAYQRTTNAFFPGPPASEGTRTLPHTP